MSDELKPCPFCGGKASRMLNGNEDDYFWWVECWECHAMIDGFTTSTEAIAAWNTRAEQAIAATLGMPEIVRCRDCRHYYSEINGCDEFGDRWLDKYANVEPDGFCSWAERREE